MNATTPEDLSFIGEPLWVRSIRHRIRIAPVVRAFGVVAIAWLPLLVIALWKPELRATFLKDSQIHVRLLVSLPILILSERLIAPRLALAVRTFLRSGIVPSHKVSHLKRLNLRIAQLRDSWLMTGVLIAA